MLRALRSDCRPSPIGEWRDEEVTRPDKWIARQERPRAWLRSVEAPKPRTSKIESAIAEAEQLSELPEGWDDENAARIDPQTIRRATQYLRSIASKLATAGFDLPIPTIAPCVDGSIDLYWKQPQFRFLMNIRAGNQLSDFYGESTSGLQVKGPFQPETPDASLFHWLVLR